MKNLFIALTLAFTTSASLSQTNPDLAAEIVTVKVKALGALTADVDMPVHVFKPTLTRADADAGQWPVVIFSHGRAATPEERANVKNPVPFGHVRFWHAKGYAVIAPVRPGYGGNGADVEVAGINFPANGGPCTGRPDFNKVATVATHAVRSAHTWLLEQSWVKKNSIVLIGQSVGGFTTVAACGQNWPGVIGCINFAGGVSGNPKTSPNASCQPERLGEAFAAAGKTTRAPSLWLYSENDLYWGPDAPKQWHKAHVDSATAAGQSSTAEFFAAPPVEPDGHRLLLQGGKLWGPVLNAWLKKNGL
jgi:dienelactone hydrolase